MSLLDDEILKGVGQVAIEFNNLDELITALAAAIFECTEWSTAEYLRGRFTAQKLEQIKEVSKILAEAHGLRDTPHHFALLDQIERAVRILNERNAVIHGELTIMHGKRPIAQLKKSTVELSPQALSELVQNIKCGTDGLLTAYYDFMDTVSLKRAKPRPELRYQQPPLIRRDVQPALSLPTGQGTHSRHQTDPPLPPTC